MEREMERKVESKVKSKVWLRRRWRTTAGRVAVGPGRGTAWGGGRCVGGVQVARRDIMVIWLMNWKSSAGWFSDKEGFNFMKITRMSWHGSSFVTCRGLRGDLTRGESVFSIFTHWNFSTTPTELRGNEVLDSCSVEQLERKTVYMGTERRSVLQFQLGECWRESWIVVGCLQNLTNFRSVPLWPNFIGSPIVTTYNCWPRHWKLKFRNDVMCASRRAKWFSWILGVSEDNAFNSWMQLQVCLFAEISHLLQLC